MLHRGSDAVKALMKAYFGKTRYRPRFDYSDIRDKGEPLITAGGKAPGPEPLRLCLTKMEALLSEKESGDQLTPFEVHRLCCMIADAVLAGGIRRAALISLFSFDDRQMATCKHGHWWVKYPELGRSNNSAVIVRGRVKKKEFLKFWELIKESGSGEPGVYFTNDPAYGTNPCCEISLREFSFCNLTTINAGTVKTQKDLDERSRVAAFWGTLQAGFTDFHYLRPEWKENSEKDSLIGVSMTGIASGNMGEMNLTQSAEIVKEENERVAELIGIRPAARCTTIKPEGTASLVCGTSSGIHAWYAPYYIRNMQCAVGDDLHSYFTKNHPELIKEMDLQPGDAVIGIPIEAPARAIMRDTEPAILFLERVKRFNLEWVREGHRSGPNYNNVSATCNVREEDDEMFPEEWDVVREWMWRERRNYNGISLLPYDNGTYRDAPFQECTRYEYNKRMKYILSNPIDLTQIHEERDNTNLQAELACAGGKCELIF